MRERTAYPRLSVVVNNYNYARFLGAALDSALAQLREGDELIVVDDGSTDDSLSLLRRYASRHDMRLIVQENRGQISSVHAGLAVATGDVAVLLDSDDYFLPGYLERLRGIYHDHPDVDFVFSRAEVGGTASRRVRGTRAMLARMELPAGRVGSTRWATILSFEFVGAPTSGNAIARPLLDKITGLLASPGSGRPMSPRLARLLGISEQAAGARGLSADAVIVRAASMLDAVKYCDPRPGFHYRVHGGNQWANTAALGRWYIRQRRCKYIVTTVLRHFSLSSEPSAAALRAEIAGRTFGRKLRRRMHVRGRYCLSALKARGSMGEKLATLAAAAGLLD